MIIHPGTPYFLKIEKKIFGYTNPSFKAKAIDIDGTTEVEIPDWISFLGDERIFIFYDSGS